MLDKNEEFLFVTWTDAYSVDEWEDREVSEKNILSETHSVGILISSDKDKIILGLNHDIANDRFSCTMIIPRGMILSIRKLRLGK